MIRDSNRMLPLQIAIEDRNWSVASILLDETIKCGFDLSQEEYPVIHLATDTFAYTQELDFIEQILIKVPGSARMKDKEGELPLMRFAQEGIANPSFLRALIEDYPEALRIPDKEGNLPLHIAPSNMESSDDGMDDYYACVRIMIDRFPEGLSTPNLKGQLPLHACISISSMSLYHMDEEMDVMRMMSEWCPESHQKLDKDGNLPLHFACAQEKPKLAVISFLAKQNEQALRTVNPKGCLPLHLAADNGSVDDSVDDDAVDDDSVVTFLLEAFPEGLQTKNDQGNLPIHVALSAGHFDLLVVKVLVEAFPEGLQTQNATGNLPLHLAIDASEDFASIDHMQVLEYLLDQFPGAARHANVNGSLPLHLACSNNHASFSHIQLLVQYFPGGLSAFDACGFLPFHRACLRDQNGALVQKMLQTWFQGKDLPWTRDHTPALFFACENHASLDVIKLFAEKSTDIFRTVASKVKVRNKLTVCL